MKCSSFLGVFLSNFQYTVFAVQCAIESTASYYYYYRKKGLHLYGKWKYGKPACIFTISALFMCMISQSPIVVDTFPKKLNFLLGNCALIK